MMILPPPSRVTDYELRIPLSGIPKPLTEAEIVEGEKVLDVLWKHVHGHSVGTVRPLKRTRSK